MSVIRLRKLAEDYANWVQGVNAGINEIRAQARVQ